MANVSIRFDKKFKWLGKDKKKKTPQQQRFIKIIHNA